MNRASAAALALVALLAGAGCIDLPERARHGVAPGTAEAVTVRAADDRPLDARLWMRDSSRLVVYIHEYRRTQVDWWPEAWRGAPSDPSAMTLDLRGHGDSGGDANDFSLMVADVRTVVAYARRRGFERVVVVGAGLGGTVAVMAARDDPALVVVGLSPAADFGDLDAAAAAAQATQHIAAVAARDDLSARESLTRLATAARLDGTRAVLLPGRAHGRDLLTGSSEAATRRLIREMSELAWRLPAARG